MDDVTRFTAIFVYIDDLVLVRRDLTEVQHMKKLLHDRFKMKDLGDLKFFLSMEVAWSSKGITLYQRKYCIDLLQDCGMLGAKPATTPMDYTSKLSKDSGEPLSDISSYQRLVGRLLYLSHTLPDICYAVGWLSQFLAFPTMTHHRAA